MTLRRRFLFLFGGPIGDSLVAIHIGRTLAANLPGTTLELLSTQENGFVRELCQDLPFVRYRSVQKEYFHSWLILLTLVMSRNTVIVFEPITTQMSLWWRFILWCAHLRPGNIELRIQTLGYEHPVPQTIRHCLYDCEKQTLFETPKMILESLDIQPRKLPLPSLTPKPVSTGKPCILFCFFAGSVSRSITRSHARDILRAARITYPSHKFILVCSRDERSRAEHMAEGITNTHVESSRTARDVISLLSGADLVVGTASGIVLIAAHLRRPLVALHNMSHAKSFMPDFSPRSIILAARNECRCRPGDGTACKMTTDEGVTYRCLYFITTKEVLSAMAQALPPK